MTPQTFEGVERRRFPALLAASALLALIVVAVAFVADSAFGWPVLALLAVCLVAAVGFRVLTGRQRSDADADDHVVRQPATRDRPLGDTPEAHDEINPHDLPIDAPGRHAAVRLAGGLGGETQGGPATADDARLTGPDRAPLPGGRH